jgi:hypothetical protein
MTSNMTLDEKPSLVASVYVMYLFLYIFYAELGLAAKRLDFTLFHLKTVLLWCTFHR